MSPEVQREWHGGSATDGRGSEPEARWSSQGVPGKRSNAPQLAVRRNGLEQLQERREVCLGWTPVRSFEHDERWCGDSPRRGRRVCDVASVQAERLQEIRSNVDHCCSAAANCSCVREQCAQRPTSAQHGHQTSDDCCV